MVVQEFDDIFVHIGGFGTYQKLLLLAALPFNFFMSYTYFSQLLATLVPDHWCKVPELLHLPLEGRRNLSIPTEVHDGKERFSQCTMYDVNFTEVLLNDKMVNQSWATTTCQHGWEYDFSEYYPTAATDFDWVCSESWRPYFSQSMLFLGAVIGIPLFGFISDIIGRLPVLVITNLLACGTGIATAFTEGFVSFVTCSFFMGMSIGTNELMMFIILLEYVSEDRRSLVANLPVAIGVTLSLVYMPWLARFLWNWRLFYIVLFVQMGFVILVPWFMPESCRWLMTKGKTERAMNILKQCARMNGRSINDETCNEFQTLAKRYEEEEKERKLDWINLFRTPNLRKRVFLLILISMITSMVFDGHVRNIVNLHHSIYLTFSISGAVEFPSDLLTIAILDCLGRRWSLSVTLIFSSVFCLAAVFVSDNQLIVTTMAMFGRFCISLSLNIASQFIQELLPTQLRGQGSSIVSSFSYAATFFSPYIASLGHINIILPFLVLGILGVIGGFLVPLLPETANEKLPDTIQQAEQFGLDQGYLYIPCLRNYYKIGVAKMEGGKKDAAENAEPENNIADEQNCVTRL